ncbi:hypothetical protein EAH72_33990 [Pseudomonas caspiana]|nr:hypothetical protein EAH72_33990 [Pseudomonas caspiana]
MPIFWPLKLPKAERLGTKVLRVRMEHRAPVPAETAEMAATVVAGSKAKPALRPEQSELRQRLLRVD